MKRTQAALLLAFLLFNLCTNAQDELLKTNGRSYTVNIMYKDDRKIKFQKYQERDKRIFTMPLYKIYALKYAGAQATKTDGSPVSEEMFAYQKISLFNQQHLKRGIAMTTIGCVIAGGGLSLIGWGIHDVTSDHGGYLPILGVMAILGGTGLTAGFLPSVIIGAKKLKKPKPTCALPEPNPSR